MKQIITVLLWALSLASAALAAEVTAWPPLPKDGFIVGRAATTADLDAGRAVFVSAKGGIVIGKPLAIKIPQYAWYMDGNSKSPVVIIQAEEANGQKIVGAVQRNGQFLAATLAEFELLGVETPSN